MEKELVKEAKANAEMMRQEKSDILKRTEDNNAMK